MSKFEGVDLSIAGLLDQYRRQTLDPQTLLPTLRRNALNYLSGGPEGSSVANPIWISLIEEAQLQVYVDRLKAVDPQSLPLYGVPFAIKDNIDLQDLETTAACPAFAYPPKENASVVELLIAAGAVPLGKTNLDQFATGLVGTRSPYGVCLNALNPEFISGGSSSGSAVAVAMGQVSFALGTDTAGSGRVPAALNDIVGLKPSKGLLSTYGVVPACRTLDCVSIFANNIDDANSVLDVAAQFDKKDAFSRQNSFENSSRYYQAKPAEQVILGIPGKEQLFWDNNTEAEEKFYQAIEVFQEQGVQFREIDFTPFMQAAKLLYEGPWVAERYLATYDIIEQQPDAMHPVVQKIIQQGKQGRAMDAFAASYVLQACKAEADQQLANVDAVMTPTIPCPYTVEQVLAAPIELNSRLGYYTNFMNLLDYAAISFPVEKLSSGLGYGVTLFHQALSDKRLLGLAAALSNTLLSGSQGERSSIDAKETILVAVCGAHMSNLPLNWQLSERGAALVETGATSASYRLYALPGGNVARPGLSRVAKNGEEIPLEVWSVPKTYFGSFVEQIPAPLGIGKVELKDGRWVSGFICEGYGLEKALDITHLGGWRAYLASNTT